MHLTEELKHFRNKIFNFQSWMIRKTTWPHVIFKLNEYFFINSFTTNFFIEKVPAFEKKTFKIAFS